MSTQIFLHSRILREHSNHSKEEFLTSYAHQALKYIHSNFSSLKEIKRSLKSFKRGVPHLICTSNSQMHHIILECLKNTSKNTKANEQEILQPQDLASFNHRSMPHLPKLWPPRSTRNKDALKSLLPLA
jgi:hypothetical protein